MPSPCGPAGENRGRFGGGSTPSLIVSRSGCPSSHIYAASPAGAAVLSKMAEALFMESLRPYMEQLPLEAIGWLAGARGPIVGAALALMHRRPSHPWTIPELAAEADASCSLLAARFQHFLGPAHLLGGMAAPACDGAAADDAGRLLSTCDGRRVRIRSGAQPRVQARVRPAADAVSPPVGRGR